MSKYAGQFEYVSPGKGVEHAGACEFSFDERTATLVPAEGPPLAFDLGDIDTLEAGDWDVRLTLYSGPTLTLRRFGKALSDFARELLDAYRGRLVQCLLVSDLNEVARFDGRVQLRVAGSRLRGPGGDSPLREQSGRPPRRGGGVSVAAGRPRGRRVRRGQLRRGLLVLRASG